MYTVMAVVSTKLGKVYLPVSEQDKKADTERDVEALKQLNAGYRFAIMDEG